MLNKPVVVICCKAIEQFCRAHVWAINRGITSVLLPAGDWPKLNEFVQGLDVRALLTDDPENSCFADYPVRDARLVDDQVLVSAQAWPDPLALLFTSGSTGKPKAIAKRADDIQHEVERICDALQLRGRQITLVSTVPVEHMFGYAFVFWVAQQLQAQRHPRKVFTPADLKKACADAATPAWVVTTPTHLRAYSRMPGGFANVGGVISATSPLLTPLARDSAMQFNTGITEIYGSTETGAMASRVRLDTEQTEPVWVPFAGIELGRSDLGTAICRLPHLTQPVELSDLVELQENGFRVLGRTGDLVKIAGKRHSLTALNSLLASSPGVTDSIYYLPAASADAPDLQRAAALVVLGGGYTTEDVISGLRGKVDDVFLPRYIASVDSIPRTDAGKVRHQDLESIFARLATHNELIEQG